MSKLPILTGEKIVKTLEKAGFEIIRQRGSHRLLRHRDGRTTVVPVHKGSDVDRGLLRKIINDADLTREEFIKLIEE
jgi:predicted RNA binding protein YcfA (HicA-like mRNA interferase family)